MPVYNTTQVLNYIRFSELMMFTSSASYSKYKSQTNSTTWVQKKTNSENIVGLTWNYNCVSGGYTSCNYLLGAATASGYNYAGDFSAFGLGLSGGASSIGTIYGTGHNKYPNIYYNCNNTEMCTTSYNYTSAAAIGTSGHRSINGISYQGLFFR